MFPMTACNWSALNWHSRQLNCCGSCRLSFVYCCIRQILYWCCVTGRWLRKIRINTSHQQFMCNLCLSSMVSYLYCCNYIDILVCPKDAFFTDCFYLVYYSYTDGPLYCICTAQLLCFYVRLGTITFILYVCMYIYIHKENSIDC